MKSMSPPVAETFAYCLRKNHFHLPVRTKSEDVQTLWVSKIVRVLTTNPSTGFSNLFNTCAKGINKTYGRTGSLFQHSFDRVVITDDRHFVAVARYLHQNPQKHRFIPDFRDWLYSSDHQIIRDNPSNLQRYVILDLFSGFRAFANLLGEWVYSTPFNKKEGL